MKRCLTRILLLPLLLGAACSPSQQLAERGDLLRAEYSQLPDYDTLPQKSLRWAEAVDMLAMNNLEYQQLQHEYQKAKRRAGRTWRNLIPMLDVGEYYNAPLKWGNGEPAHNSFNVNVIFNIPSLLTMPVEQYTDALAVIKADTELKLKKRELEARLYKLFCEYELLEREEQLQGEKSETSEAQKRLQALQFATKRRSGWAELGKLLNNYSARWVPDTGGMPRVRIENYRKRMEAPDGLFVSALALQYEASRLGKLGAALQFAPSVYVNFFSPSLFSSTGGKTEGFMRNADDVRVDLNAYLRIDTRLDMYYDYKHAAAAHELTQQQLTQQMQEHKEKLALLVESWQQYLDWKDSVATYIAFRNARGVSGMEEALELHGESQELEQGVIEQERANLERECALRQEYGG